MSEFAHVSPLRYSEASNRTGNRPRACGAQEIAYRWGQEASAMRRLSDNELEVVFKNGWKPSEYVASTDG
ncbi:MAG: hypothetical protein MK126_13105 [Dehalococcoidia bacterium]|nr:hypothetical protein [Dehalococcoidia bacterium]